MGKEEEYKPEEGFEEDSREPQLVDVDLTDSTELLLLQFPLNQLPDFDGKELSINLNQEGCSADFDCTGKVYEMVSCAADEPNLTVFASSGSQAKILGKISRRISLVHYPEPKVLEEQETEKKKKRLQQMSVGTSFINTSHYSTPTQSSKRRGPSFSRGHPVSAHSSRQKSSLSEVGAQTSSRTKSIISDRSVLG